MRAVALLPKHPISSASESPPIIAPARPIPFTWMVQSPPTRADAKRTPITEPILIDLVTPLTVMLLSDVYVSSISRRRLSHPLSNVVLRSCGPSDPNGSSPELVIAFITSAIRTNRNHYPLVIRRPSSSSRSTQSPPIHTHLPH